MKDIEDAGRVLAHVLAESAIKVLIREGVVRDASDESMRPILGRLSERLKVAKTQALEEGIRDAKDALALNMNQVAIATLRASMSLAGIRVGQELAAELKAESIQLGDQSTPSGGPGM